MINIVVKANSRQDGDKWVPEGMVSFPSGPNLTERREWCENAKFDTKEEADQYFMQACKKKYRIAN